MPLSYSAVKTYEQCPSKYKFSRIDRLPEPSGPQAERGKTLHAEIENALKNNLPLLSDDVKHLAERIEEWKVVGAVSEMEIAVTDDWKETSFDDKDSLFRGIIDLYYEENDCAIVIDFKTGKIRDYSDQVAVYAALVMSCKPHIQSVRPIIEFIDHRQTTNYAVHKREDLEKMQKDLQTRVHRVQFDPVYAPNPSFLCRYCHYRKDNGGPCKW